jgi:threonine synthase
MNWELPDWILYPAGGGTGLIGMWKAFDEMESLGWISGKRPRMVAVQSSGCAPIVKAFHEGKKKADPWPDAHTVAAGLRVPAAIADFLMLRILRASGGTAVMVDDSELREAILELGRCEGLYCAPEGAICLPALRDLRNNGFLKSDDSIVLFSTGAGIKYSVVD